MAHFENVYLSRNCKVLPHSEIRVQKSLIWHVDNCMCGRSGGETVNFTPCKDDGHADGCNVVVVVVVDEVVGVADNPGSKFCAITPQVG